MVLYTVETVLDTLKRFDINEKDLQAWEKQLGLQIPVDEYGRKEYSPHHVNLFKNVKKHLTLGRTIDEVKTVIDLPPLTQSQQISKISGKSAYASAPNRPKLTPSEGAATVVELVHRLTEEKDNVYKKLIETEKLNSHLYSANNMFHSRVKELSARIEQLRSDIKENQNFKLMDDKARLHKQLIDGEKAIQARDLELRNREKEMLSAQEEISVLKERISGMTDRFDPACFCGDWVENGQLLEVCYDNFGINIEPERTRLFRITETPERIFGNTAVVTTSYQYETNKLWTRNETLTVSYLDPFTLKGELSAEYILDGVPVAKALYRVTCHKNR